MAKPTIKGLQAENADLQQEILELKQQIRDLKTEVRTNPLNTENLTKKSIGFIRGENKVYYLITSKYDEDIENIVHEEKKPLGTNFVLAVSRARRAFADILDKERR